MKQHVPLDRLDAVLLSHAHPDHWTELPTLCNAFRFVLGRDDLPVIGPQEVLTCLEEAFGAPVSPTFALEEAADGDEFDLGPIELRCSATDHPGNTLAFHMSAGEAAIAYDPDGCQNWLIDDGIEGYSSPRYDPVSGLPICNNRYPPGTVIGPYQTESAALNDWVPSN